MALRTAHTRAKSAEAERPFWISLSDLMTALMTLFLVAVAVAVHEVNKGLDDKEKPAQDRAASIDTCMADVRGVAARIPGVTVRDDSIDFGARANFQLNRHELTPEQISVLRGFVPQVLTLSRGANCKPWLKRIVVDGFASREGTYLRNLDLSIERSERVLCVLLNTAGDDALDVENRRTIQQLFFAGGSSFNSLKDSPAESRRIEMKLEFYDLKEPRQNSNREVPLDTDSTCPIDRR